MNPVSYTHLRIKLNMAQTRKDLRGRVLRKGESQRRSDERYVYTYTCLLYTSTPEADPG